MQDKSREMESERGGSACDPVQILPVDVTIEIFGHLTIFDRMRLMCVSERWREHLLEPHLWTNVDLSAITTSLSLDQRETRAPSPWSRVPQSRPIETKDIKVLYMASPDQDQLNQKPSRTTQLCRYLDKAADNLGCRYIDNNPTNKWGSSYYLSSLHLVDCVLDHQFGSADSQDTGFASLRNLRHLKLESCQNYLRGGLPPTLETLLVYGGCIGGVGGYGDEPYTPLDDWKLSKLDKIHTVDVTMPSLTNEDIMKIIRNRSWPDKLRNLTYYAQSDDDYSHLIECLKHCRLEKLTLHGGGFLVLRYCFDTIDCHWNTLKSFTCHSVFDGCDATSIRDELRAIYEYSFGIEEVCFLDCPYSDEDRQRLQGFAKNFGFRLEFCDGGYVKGPPFYVHHPSNSIAPMVHEDPLPMNCRLEEAVLGWQRW